MLWLLPYLVWLSPAAFLYWLVFASERPRPASTPYSQSGWHFPLKRLWALLSVRRLKAARAKRLAALAGDPAAAHQAREEAVFLPTEYERRLEEPRLLLAEGIVDSLCFHGADFNGNYLVVRMTRMRHCLARVALQLKMGDSVYQLPQMPDSLMSRTGSTWSAGGEWGGLRLEVVEPLRTWRVAFNGVLREGAPRQHQDWDGLPGDQAGLRHVRLHFLWHACSDRYDCRHDWSAELLADTLAREPWRSDKWIDIIKGHVGGYDQWGTLHGEVRVEAEEAVELYLRGLRQRRWGANEAGRLHRRLTVSGVLKNGAMFSVGADCHPGHLSHATYGHVRTPQGDLHSITRTSLSLPDLAEDPEHIPKHFVLKFSAGGVRYASAVHLPRAAPCTVLCERPWSWLMLLEPAECSLEFRGAEGVMEGVGLAELCYRYDGPCPLPAASPAPALHLRESKTLQDPGRLLLDLEERACRRTSLVGGKGASLAVLTALAREDKDPGAAAAYSVPAGFCLTVTALERQLASSPALRAAVDGLAEAAAGAPSEGVDAALSARCEAVGALFAREPVCAEVAAEVRSALRRLEEAAAGEAPPGTLRWAVRSSAVGEDSDELSAAGQNATFLGCRGAEAVLDGVRRCWASLFALQSVQYRRQHAQPVDAPMAVVVQRMVEADTAGVLFTCDPSSGDPRTLLVTANYGLGESVVSAAVDPDVLVVRRDMTGAMRVAERRIGDKKHRIVLSESGGTVEEAVAAADSSAVCLTDAQVLSLARAAARLERAFGGARDVEWAFAGGRLHLLQSRPVTALFNWTEFELLHEMDTPFCSDEDVCSTANTGEVLPGATSPLGLSTVTRACDMCTSRAAANGDVNRRFNSCIPVTHNHVTINVLSVMLLKVGRELDMGTHVVDLAIYGHRATTPEMHRAALRRNGSRADALMKAGLFLESATRAWNAARMVRTAQRLNRELDVHERAARATTARAVMRVIVEALPKVTETLSLHSFVSSVSSFSQIIAVVVLTEGAKELSTDHLTDVAAMLSCTGGDVVSAGIPTAMQAIASAIRDGCPAWQDFVDLAPEQGMQWLEQHCPKAHHMTAAFLQQFGCRVVREFDPKTVTWDEEPSRLVASLQSLVGNARDGAQDRARPTPASVHELVDRLKSPKKATTRFLLRRLLPWFQSAVVNREFTKEAVIHLIHKFRQAFRRLGALLEKEGRLPDRELTGYLSLWELHCLASQQPDPVLIAKARRRRRCYPAWDALSFPEIMYGVPKPMQFEEPDPAVGGEVVTKGTPVSESSVTARACVVLGLEGAQGVAQLRAGDVLITHSTDVGWSPYFPMLGGVVTELGGLISHGAVVAREYGLPCLVGVQGATRLFKTGDTVNINGKTGALSKVK
ncbi:Putative phosphoenolpyruvate synthase [Frankliniella fusca]|uniref:Phosphoenolpyruvate synthase n=1 Tax=Frankliniella fusca TaxID=407009 RepID=A0AAE1H9L5_9NEOP|nr:Putative phosphoenolpyruvate synthase [Frankliniella fusca]